MSLLIFIFKKDFTDFTDNFFIVVYDNLTEQICIIIQKQPFVDVLQTRRS